AEVAPGDGDRQVDGHRARILAVDERHVPTQETRRAHVDLNGAYGAVAIELEPDRLHARIGLDAKLLAAGDPALVDVASDAADAVAAHAAAAAVRVVHLHA